MCPAPVQASPDSVEPAPTVARARLAHELKLSQVLKRRMEAEGGYLPLARAISNSVPEAERGVERDVLIDRRKLKALIDGDPDTALSLRELSYLDRYLDRFGEGLAHNPIFDHDDLLRTLAKTGNVTFLLGTKPDGPRLDVSHWDVLAMAWLQRGINASDLSVRFEIIDVQLRSEGPEDSLFGDHGPSLVAVGSSQSNAISEKMLCKMLGRDAQRSPFGFVWSPERQEGVPESPLKLGVEPPDARTARELKRAQASALVGEEKVYLDELSRIREGGRCYGKTYALCAAQRRRSGKIWLVLAGVTGVATYVAAKLVGDLQTRLHEPATNRHSPVYWGVAEAHVPEYLEEPLTSQRDFPNEAIVSHHVFTLPSRGSE
jgi:hypothetical protein